MAALRPEVAALYELTTTATKLHVQRLGYDVDLTQISVAEAEALLELPGGFEWLRRKPEPAPESAAPRDSETPAETPENNVGAVAETTAPTRTKKRKKGA